MCIITIGSDRSIFSRGSTARLRVEKQAKLCEGLHIVVFSLRSHELHDEHTETLHLYPTNSRTRLGSIYRAVRITRRILREQSKSTPIPMVLSAQDPFEAGIAAYWARGKRHVPLQLQIHTDLFNSAFIRSSLLNHVRAALAKFLLPRATCVRVVSERIRISLEPLGLSGSASVLPVFIDRSAIDVALPFQRGAFLLFSKLLLVSSRLEKEKDVEYAILAMKAIKEKIPDAGLLIAGTGSQKQYLERLVTQLGLDKNVVFLGYRSDIFSLYKMVDVVLNTSQFEGFGASIVEALAAGCPVVSTDVGVAKEAGAVVVTPDAIAEAALDILVKHPGEKVALRLPLLDETAYMQKYHELLATCQSR